MPTTPTVTHWGPFLVESDGETVTAVHGHPLDPDPSPIGQGLLAATECRVARPAVRRSWLEGGPGTANDRRGAEPFVSVGWDEALDLVASELRRVRDDHGHPSIYAGSYGWGSAGRVHTPSATLSRFFHQFGGATDSRGSYSASAAEAIVPHVLGMSYTKAVAEQTAWRVIADHTRLFVSFGGLRLSNTQVTYGGQGPHHTAGWLAQSTGTRFVNVGPLADDQATTVDGEWLPLRPGTDTALMLGLAHTLVVEGLADEAFLDRHCTGWEHLRRYLLGEAGGVIRDAAWAAGICGLDATAIVDLARRMAATRTLIDVSLSVQRTDHGEQAYWMAIALAAVLGQIGLPGGGVALSFGSNGNVGAGQVPKRVPGLPVPLRPPGCPTISVSRVVDLLERPGGTFRFNGATDTYPDIELVYWAGGNVFHHHQDLNRLRRAWQRPATVVVHEPFWNPMARHADIVLPATTPLERDDLGGAETALLAMKAALPVQGDARHDYDIFAALATRLGFGDTYTEGRSGDDWVRHCYDRFREGSPEAPDFDRFWHDGALVHADMAMMGDTDQVFLAEFRADPEGRPLRTPSGRIELWSEVIAGFGYADCPPHPTWLEPFERLGTPAAVAHPLHLVSNQPGNRLHSQYDHSAWSRAAKVAGREPIRIHPDDAAERGIVDGDVVRVVNDRGACLAGAALSDALMPGVVQLSTGAWYDPGPDGTCKHGNPNVLTRDKGTSQLAQGPSAHTCLVEVERVVGEPPPVTAFDPPELVDRDGDPSRRG